MDGEMQGFREGIFWWVEVERKLRGIHPAPYPVQTTTQRLVSAFFRSVCTATPSEKNERTHILIILRVLVV